MIYTVYLIDPHLNALVDYEYVTADTREGALAQRPAHWPRRCTRARAGFAL